MAPQSSTSEAHSNTLPAPDSCSCTVVLLQPALKSSVRKREMKEGRASGANDQRRPDNALPPERSRLDGFAGPHKTSCPLEGQKHVPAEKPESPLWEKTGISQWVQKHACQHDPFRAPSSSASCSDVSHLFCSRQAECCTGPRMRQTAARSGMSRKSKATELP